MSTKNVAINYLRACITLLVLAHHSFLAYAFFLPATSARFVAKPYLWAAFPVIDTQRWARGFDLFFLFNDTFFMSLMFFLAGLFVCSSVARKGISTHLRDRFLRLGLPFLMVGVLLMPLAYYPSYILRGGEPAMGAYLQQWISLDPWSSGPCWFIAVLLAFDLLGAFLTRLSPRLIQRLGNMCAGAYGHPARFFWGLIAASSVAYLLLSLPFGPTRWFAFGPLAIQAGRILLYLTYFLAGMGIGVWGVDRGLLAQDGRLAQHWARWLGAAILAFVLLVVVNTQLLAASAPTSPLLQSISGVALALSCGASSFFLLACFVRFAQQRSRILDSLSTNAYGMYLIHYFFVTWLQYALLDVKLLPFQKGAIVFTATVLLSWSVVAGARPIFDAYKRRVKRWAAMRSEFGTHET
ncbi:MAG: acyltransferase [Burkholderiales bacterium]|nr:acyltransferase [Burkholderiales bacterium]